MDDLVFIGDWIKDRVLGSGSFGTVVLWKHKNTEEKLAIKSCKWGDDELTAKHKERWSKEVEMLQNCNNPNIVGTKALPAEFVSGLATANPSRLPILCMEYCSGGDLRQLLNKTDSCAGLKESQVRQILSDVCNAIQFLHSYKITHRDLKPENIVVNIDPSPSLSPQTQAKVTYKLIDLGYAKEIDSNSVCASFVGTLQYLAPEILYSKTYSNSVDYWSFGLLAFEIICGTRPFLPFMAPVQWMPYVKKKAHDNICVYETFHGDIEYSNEVFPEIHISSAFKTEIEQWLRVALEWDPKLRGRDAPSKVSFSVPAEKNQPGQNSSNIVFFSLLENSLNTKIIKVFSVHTLSQHSYRIDNKTTISTLKLWLSKETDLDVQDQVLLSQTTFVDIDNNDLVVKYWNENCNTMVFLFNKTDILRETVEPKVPKAVQRCLEHPKALYNFKNSQNLYRSGLFFVMSQKEIYESLIHGLFTRGEAMKYESKQLLLRHNVVDKNIGKLITQDEVVTKTVEIGKKHIQNIRETGVGSNYLGGFDKIFDKADDISEKVTKLQLAWNQLSVRLQSAARRSNEIVLNDINNFVAKYNFNIVFTNAMKAYVAYKKNEFYSEFKNKEKQCHDIMKVCYECLKLRSKIISEIRHQPFVLKLMDLSTEFAKISEIVSNAADTAEKLTKDLASMSEDLNSCMWTTLSLLASDAEHAGDLPYSVISCEKKHFKIGESVSNHCIKMASANHTEDDNLRSLVEESFKIRKHNENISQKINSQKELMNKSLQFDFSFLKDN